MAANVYIQTEQVDHIRFQNDTGADVAQYDFNVPGPYAAVADEAITSGSVGPWHVEEGILIQASDLKTGENTFATLGQKVYFDASTLEFSDTETVGYYHVGYLTTVKDANGVIVFEKMRYHEIVTS
jgi:hypothetical protein